MPIWPTRPATLPKQLKPPPLAQKPEEPSREDIGMTNRISGLQATLVPVRRFRTGKLGQFIFSRKEYSLMRNAIPSFSSLRPPTIRPTGVLADGRPHRA